MGLGSINTVSLLVSAPSRATDDSRWCGSSRRET
jgi:hypothetical protein